MTNDILSSVGVHSLQRAMKPHTSHQPAPPDTRIITYAIAHRSAWDAGCRSAQRAGRVEWSIEDHDACLAEFRRIFHCDP